MPDVRAWTPGPWYMDSVDTPFFLWDGVCQGGDDSGDRVVFAEDGEPLLATLPKLDGSWFGGRLGMDKEAIHVQQANAELIAASPELYDALEDLVNGIQQMANDDRIEVDVDAFLADAKAALARANGAAR